MSSEYAPKETRLDRLLRRSAEGSISRRFGRILFSLVHLFLELFGLLFVDKG